METKGEMTVLTVGDKFPAITVPVQQGVSALPAGETLNLGDTGGKWKIVFHWPTDFTFICPTEIIGYGDLKHHFADRDAALIGASNDTDFVHCPSRHSEDRPAHSAFPWPAAPKQEAPNALGPLHKDACPPKPPHV